MRHPESDAEFFARQKELSIRPNDESAVMYQSWRHLLFLHWRYRVEELQSLLPAGLKIQTFDGDAWVGIVPFYMRNIRPRFLPAIPWVSNFLEMNLRTYVVNEDGIPGVWFFSLDANQPIAVWTARQFFHLPYFHAEMDADSKDKSVRYSSRRSSERSESASIFEYRFGAEESVAEFGTLDYFLLERYLLFASSTNGKDVFSGRVHHSPYPVSAVELEEWDARLFAINGLKVPLGAPDHVAYSRGVDVEIFWAQAELGAQRKAAKKNDRFDFRIGRWEPNEP